MKNKFLCGVLIPLSTMAVALTSTSCGYKSDPLKMVNLLDPYKSNIQPLHKGDMDYLSASITYNQQIRENSEIIKQDILSSYSTLLTDPTWNIELKKIVEFNKFDMGFNYNYKVNSHETETLTSFSVEMRVNVIGQGKDIWLDESSQLSDFDLSFNFKFDGNNSLFRNQLQNTFLVINKNYLPENKLVNETNENVGILPLICDVGEYEWVDLLKGTIDVSVNGLYSYIDAGSGKTLDVEANQHFMTFARFDRLTPEEIMTFYYGCQSILMFDQVVLRPFNRVLLGEELGGNFQGVVIALLTDYYKNVNIGEW